MVTFYGSHICGGCREAKELFAQKLNEAGLGC